VQAATPTENLESLTVFNLHRPQGVWDRSAIAYNLRPLDRYESYNHTNGITGTPVPGTAAADDASQIYMKGCVRPQIGAELRIICRMPTRRSPSSLYWAVKYIHILYTE